MLGRSKNTPYRYNNKTYWWKFQYQFDTFLIYFKQFIPLTSGLSLQTLETYKDFIDTDEISFGGNNFEIYFEEVDFDSFIDKLQNYDIQYVHPVKEHSWEQLVVRLYDPDKHIIEVGENIKVVCKRFLDSSMTPDEVAERMDVRKRQSGSFQ